MKNVRENWHYCWPVIVLGLFVVLALAFAVARSVVARQWGDVAVISVMALMALFYVVSILFAVERE